MPKKINKKSGFTLLEILLVVGIISILAGIVIVAVNPVKQLNSVRNAQRKSDMKQINSAVLQYYIKNFEFPPGIDSTIKEICDTGELSTLVESGITCTDLVDLTPLVPTYLTAIPVDPSGPIVTFLNKIINTAYAATGGTGYQIKVDSNKIGIQSIREPSIVVGMEPEGGEVGGGTLGDGLVAHYKMNEVGGTNVEDSSGNGNDATSASTITPTTGRVNGAISFDGGSNGLTTPISPFAGEFSTSFWVKSSNTGVQQGIAYSNAEWYIDPSDYFAFWTGSSDNHTSIDVVDGAWHHIVVKRDVDNLISIYVAGESAITPWTESGTFGLFDLLIPGLDANGLNGIVGYLDDFRIYDRALTEEEITALAAGTEAE